MDDYVSLHRSNTGEGGEIENPELTPRIDAILQWCKPITKAADTPQTLAITFDRGVPTALDGTAMPLWKLIMTCNTIGAQHGVGVFQLIEDRIVGLKVRGVYENPGASILIAAHKRLQYLVSTREENEFSAIVDNKWSPNPLTHSPTGEKGAADISPILAELCSLLHEEDPSCDYPFLHALPRRR